MKILAFLLLNLTTLGLSAQTNFNNWDLFKSDLYNFSLKYPDNWEVDEEMKGNFQFHNPYERLGVFRIIVVESVDSATCERAFMSLEAENAGSSVNKFHDKQILLFKTMSIHNGESIEIHNWVIQSGIRLYKCSYSFNFSLRNAPNLVEEMKLAYQTIESFDNK